MKTFLNSVQKELEQEINVLKDMEQQLKQYGYVPMVKEEANATYTVE